MDRNQEGPSEENNMSTDHNKWAVTCPKCRNRYTWTGPLSPVPPCPHCAKEKATPIDQDADVKEALAIIDEMEELAGEVPEAAEDFATNVLEKAQSIGRTIERSRSVTSNQLDALNNMRDGLTRWIRD